MLTLTAGDAALRFDGGNEVIVKARLSALFAIHDNRVPFGEVLVADAPRARFTRCAPRAQANAKVLTVRTLGKHVSTGTFAQMARTAELLESASRYLPVGAYGRCDLGGEERAQISRHVAAAREVVETEYMSRNYAMVLRGEEAIASARALLGLHAREIVRGRWGRFVWNDRNPLALCIENKADGYRLGESFAQLYEYTETGDVPAARVVCYHTFKDAPTQAAKRNLFWADVGFLAPLYQADNTALQARSPWIADRYPQALAPTL